MADFLVRVTDVIRRFIPKDDATEFELKLGIVNELGEKLDKLLADAEPGTEGEVWQTAYDYAINKMGLYSTAMNLLIVIQAVHEEIWRESLAETYQLMLKRDGLETRKPTAKSGAVGEWTDREEWIEDVGMLGNELRLKEKTELTPAKVAFNRICTMVRALSHRSTIEFPVRPPAPVPGAKVSHHVVQKSPSEMIDGGARYFASQNRDHVRRVMDQAEHRAERQKRRDEKRAQRELERERLQPLMDKRKEKMAIHETVVVPVTTRDRK